MGRYSPAPVPTTDLPNTQRFLREELEQVRNSTDDIYTLANFLLDNFVTAGYGSIKRTTPVALADIGATWQQLPWEAVGITDPKGMAYDLPTGMIVEHFGIWALNLLVNLAFDDANAGRDVQIRLVNVSDGTAATPVTFFVGRNQDGVSIPLPTLVESTGGTDISISQVAATKTLALEIRSEADTFTSVVFEAGVWSFNYVSEYGGNYEDIGITQR